MSGLGKAAIARLVDMANGTGSNEVRASALAELKRHAPHLIQPEGQHSAQAAMPQEHYDFCRRMLAVIETQEKTEAQEGN